MEKHYLVVKNSTKPCLVTLRHIVTLRPEVAIEDAIEDYYRVFRKLDGDKFYLANTYDEMIALVERED